MATLAVMFYLLVCFVFYFTHKFLISLFLSLFSSHGQWCMAQSGLIGVGFLHH